MTPDIAAGAGEFVVPPRAVVVKTSSKMARVRTYPPKPPAFSTIIKLWIFSRSKSIARQMPKCKNLLSASDSGGHAKLQKLGPKGACQNSRQSSQYRRCATGCREFWHGPPGPPGRSLGVRRIRNLPEMPPPIITTAASAYPLFPTGRCGHIIKSPAIACVHC